MVQAATGSASGPAIAVAAPLAASSSGAAAAARVGGASALRETGVGDIMKEGFASPWAIALEVVLVGGVILLTQIDWSKYSRRPPNEPEAASD